jgi:hypothetical protein
MRTLLTFASSLPLCVSIGCVTNDIPDPEGRPPQCDSATYVAFDDGNHAEQAVYTGAHAQMGELMEAAIETPAEAAVKLAAAKDVYENAAGLRDELSERKDERFADAPEIGAALDARILAALDAGAAATTAHEVEVNAEIVDKAFTEFFFLSVIHEMHAGQAKTWDEAFGYYGAPADNDAAALAGFSGVAARRDANNGTALEGLIFQKIVEGSCVLAEKLEAQQAEAIDAVGDEDLGPIVATIESAMTDVLAYSVGHELIEIGELQEANDVENASVKLVEAEAFFQPLERLMVETGGESATRAELLRTAFDDALASTDGAWLATFDHAGLLAAVEAERGIDVKE